MRRININKGNKILTKSFENKSQFIKFLRGNEDFLFTNIPDHCFDIADNVWDLNVGSMYFCCGLRFSINGKRRAGNKMINNTRIGDQI